MTSSKSKASRNKLLAFLLVIGAFFVPSLAEASRKRVVILELEGPKAEKFHEDIVKLVKKSHTVIPIEKWNSTAEDLGATKLTDGNIKKVAKKLKIDAIIQGRIEKRRDQYIVQLKLRAGSSGSVIGNRIDTSADGPRLDGKASSDLKDELIATIDSLKKGGGGGGDDEEEEDAPKKKKPVEEDEEEEEEAPKSKKELAAEAAKKKKEEAEAAKAEKEAAKEAERVAAEEKKKKKKKADEEEDEDAKPKKGFGGKGDMDQAAALKTKQDDEDEEEEAKPKKKAKKSEDDEDEEPRSKGKKGKKVAARDDDEEGVEAEADEPATRAGDLTPSERAIDAALGLSFSARRLAFTTTTLINNKPPPYNGVPVAGVNLEGTVYPLAIGHKSNSPLRHLGITGMYDRVIKIESRTDAGDVLKSKQQRFAVGALYRYPLASTFTAGLSLRYSKQSFTIGGGSTAPLPDVSYSIINPTAFFKIGPIGGKVIVNLSVGFLGVMSTGAIQSNDQYGAATVTGVEGEGGIDFMVTKNIFARAAFRYEQFGYKFKGSGVQSTSRDMDPSTQDVFGASDKYIGATVLAGYVY